jgi:type IV pilus assembly protein PilC
LKQFTYTAKDRSNKTIKGTISALSLSQGFKHLREKRLINIKLKEIKEKKESLLDINITWGPFGRVSPEETLIFTKKLATMIRIGLTVLDTLILVKHQTKNPAFKNVIDKVINNINSGVSFSDALKLHTRYFDQIFISMVEAGEASGKLDQFLDRLVEGQEKLQKIRSGIKSALFYPITLLVITVFIMYFMLTKVVPTFVKMYQNSHKALPFATQIIIDASNWILNPVNLILLIASLLILNILHKLIYKYIYSYKYSLHFMALKLPLFGNIIVKSTVARLTLLLANLFAAGVDISEILRISTKVINNLVFVEAMERISRKITTGADLSSLFIEEAIFPAEISQLIQVGEKTGKMDEMLTSASNFYQEEFESVVKGLTTIIEPLMIVFIGGIIGLLVIALYLPIFDVGSAVGK